MTGEEFLKWSGIGLLGIVGLVVVAMGTLVLRSTEPWYDNRLVDHMRSGGRTPVDESLIPRSIPADEALTLLYRSGFSCLPQSSAADEIEKIDCKRIRSSLVCSASYEIVIELNGATVTKATATSRSMCP